MRHIVIKKEKKEVIKHLQSNLRLWYRTLTGAPRDIIKRLHFPIYFCQAECLSTSNELVDYVQKKKIRGTKMV